jgi:chaperone BCS1
LENLPEKDMSKFVEVMKIIYTHEYEYENGKEYMLIPDANYRTKIFSKYQDKYDIYLEVKKNKVYSEKSKNKFIIIVNGKNNFNVINSFMKHLLASHKKQMQKKSSQSLFEFMRSYRDEDRRDRQTMEYREFPFKSNKFLDKNIFFEGKKEFIQFIDRFCEKNELKDDDIYEISGVTKKACILLAGPPGCGKSCIVKGILNRTKRDGIVVPWTRLKTCNEFCNLFRSQKINDVPFDLKNYVFIFEDFDANKSEILKQRKREAFELEELIKSKKSTSAEQTDEKIDDALDSKISLMSLISDMGKKNDDELNLECVLNTLDGIAELQDAIIIFTTNHLENIDPAFYRSGRVDYLLNMKLASKNVIKEMVQTYFQISDIDKCSEAFEKMIDYRISTADVQSICFKYGKDRLEECLEALVCKQTNKNAD